MWVFHQFPWNFDGSSDIDRSICMQNLVTIFQEFNSKFIWGTGFFWPAMYLMICLSIKIHFLFDFRNYLLKKEIVSTVLIILWGWRLKGWTHLTTKQEMNTYSFSQHFLISLYISSGHFSGLGKRWPFSKKSTIAWPFSF